MFILSHVISENEMGIPADDHEMVKQDDVRVDRSNSLKEPIC